MAVVRASPLCYPFKTLTPIAACAFGKRGVAAWTVAALFAALPFAAPAAQRPPADRPRADTAEVTIAIDGRVVELSPSFVSRDRALVSLFSSPQPGRSLAAALQRFGAKPSFEPTSGTVIIVKGPTTMTMRLGSPVLEINGNRQVLESVPIIFRGRVMVPIRAVAETLGAYVEWSGPHKLVLVTQRKVTPAGGDESPFSRWLRAALDAVLSYLATLWGGLWRGVLAIPLVWFIVWLGRKLFRRFVGRARVHVIPFSAPSFEGFPEHSVSIFAGLMERITIQAAASQSLAETSGYLGTAKGPVLIYPELGDIAAISKVVSVVDKGKVLTALIEAVTRPEFRISGSVLRSGTDADVAVRVDRYGMHFWAGSDRQAEANLTAITKDLGFTAIVRSNSAS